MKSKLACCFLFTKSAKSTSSHNFRSIGMINYLIVKDNGLFKRDGFLKYVYPLALKKISDPLTEAQDALSASNVIETGNTKSDLETKVMKLYGLTPVELYQKFIDEFSSYLYLSYNHFIIHTFK